MSSAGEVLTLTGVIAQADASLQSATGGRFQLSGGFRTNEMIALADDGLFMDGFEGS